MPSSSSRTETDGASKSEADRAPTTPEDRLRAMYEQNEAATGDVLERFISKPSFGALMARSAENVAALTRIANEIGDLMLRNLRIAGRADIVRLARQLHRTEDKLERVLQEVELLRDELHARVGESGPREGRGAGK